MVKSPRKFGNSFDPAPVEEVEFEADPVVEAKPEPKTEVAKPATVPSAPAPNTEEHGHGGVFRSTGEGRRVRIR